MSLKSLFLSFMAASLLLSSPLTPVPAFAQEASDTSAPNSEEEDSGGLVSMPQYEVKPTAPPLSDGGRGSTATNGSQESGLQATGNSQSQTAQTQNTGGVLPQTASLQSPTPSQALLGQTSTKPLGVVSSPTDSTPDVTVAPSETLSVSTNGPKIDNQKNTKALVLSAAFIAGAGLLVYRFYRKRGRPE